MAATAVCIHIGKRRNSVPVPDLFRHFGQQRFGRARNYDCRQHVISAHTKQHRSFEDDTHLDEPQCFKWTVHTDNSNDHTYGFACVP